MAHADSKGTSLKPKKVKGRVVLLQAIQYRKCMVYIRMIDNQVFMYDLIFNNQLYSSYIVITPKNTSKKLTQEEIMQSGALIFQGAMTTLDMLTENKTNDKDTLRRAQMVINSHEKSEKRLVN